MNDNFSADMRLNLIDNLFDASNKKAGQLKSKLATVNHNLQTTTQKKIEEANKKFEAAVAAEKEMFDATARDINSNAKATPEEKKKRLELLKNQFEKKCSKLKSDMNKSLEGLVNGALKDVIAAINEVMGSTWNSETLSAVELSHLATAITTKIDAGTTGALVATMAKNLEEMSKNISDGSEIKEDIKQFIAEYADSQEPFFKYVESVGKLAENDGKGTDAERAYKALSAVRDHTKKEMEQIQKRIENKIKGIALVERKLEDYKKNIGAGYKQISDRQLGQIKNLEKAIEQLKKDKEKEIAGIGQLVRNAQQKNKMLLMLPENQIASLEKEFDAASERANSITKAASSGGSELATLRKELRDLNKEDVKESTAMNRKDAWLKSTIDDGGIFGSLVKATMAGRTGKGSFVKGAMSSIKSDLHSSFKKWAYGGKGVSGLAKMLIGGFIDSKIEKRHKSKIASEYNRLKKELATLQGAYENEKASPHANAKSLASKKAKWLEALKALRMMELDEATGGQASLAARNPKIFGQMPGAEEMKAIDAELATTYAMAGSSSSIGRGSTIVPTSGEHPIRSRVGTVVGGLKTMLRRKFLPQKDVGYGGGAGIGGALSALHKKASVSATRYEHGGEVGKVSGFSIGGKLASLGKAAAGKIGMKKESELFHVSKTGTMTILPSKGEGVTKVVRSLGGNAGPTGSSSTGKGMQYETSAEYEMRQREAADRHSIAENVATIVQLLQEQAEGNKKKESKGFLDKLLDFLFGAKNLLNLIKGGAIFKAIRRGISSLGRILMKPLARIGGMIASAMSTLSNSIRSMLGLKPEVPKPGTPAAEAAGAKPKAAEVKAKAAEAKAKGGGKFAKAKEAFKKGVNPKNLLKSAGGAAKGLARGLGKGLLAGVATELLIEGITRGSASALGLSEEQRERAREEREAMEVGYGRNDIYAGDLSDAEAEEAERAQLERSSEIAYRKRCKELNIHYKTNQDSWFSASKDYRSLTFKEIMALGPEEREYFNAWLHSKEGESKLFKLQKEHPEVFGHAPGAKKGNPLNAGSASAAALAITKAKIDAMRARAKNPSLAMPTKEAQEAAKKMQEGSIIPPGLGGAAALGLGAAAGGGIAAAKLAVGAGIAGLGAAGLGAAGAAGSSALVPDTHHGGMFSGLKAAINSAAGKENKGINDLVFSIDNSTKNIDKNVESIYKMIRYIKVDGVALGDLLDKKPTIPGVGNPAAKAGGSPSGSYGGGAGGGAGGYGGGGGAGAGGGGYGGDFGGAVVPGKELGWLTQGHETGDSKNPTSFISTGKGDKGGVSYGSNQLASKEGSIQSFLKYLQTADPALYQQLAPLAGDAQNYNGQFANKWRELSADPNGALAKADRGYKIHKYYGGGLRQLDKIDPALKARFMANPALQEMLLSTSRQHGEEAGVINIFRAAGINSGMSDEEIIERVYNERGKEGANGKLAHFQKSGMNMQEGLRKRFPAEKAKVLAYYRQLKSGQIPMQQSGGPAPSGSPAPSGGGGSMQPIPPSGSPSAGVATPPPSGGGSIPVSNPSGEGGGGFSGGPSGPSSAVINFGNESAQRSFDSLNPTFRGRMLGAAAEYMKRTGKKIRISGPRCSRRTVNEQAGLAARSKPGYAAKASENAPHVQGLAVDVTSADATAMDTMGILGQFGLTRPLWPGIKTRDGHFVKEAWHIEPRERRVGLAARSKEELMAQFGASPAYYGASGNDFSGSGLVGQGGGGGGGTPAPGMGQSQPVSDMYAGGSAQTTQPVVNYNGGPSGGPSGGGTMQQVPPASGGSPSLGMGGSQAPGAGGQGGGGGLAGKLLGIAKRNADISGAKGYSQKNRLGANQFDCSSFVGRSLEEAGYNVGPIGEFTTATMGNTLKNIGFQWHAGIDSAQPGDIMFRPGHTEIYIGNGKTIGALNSTRGVGIHPVSWGKYTGYWRDGSIAQMSPEEAAAAAGAPAAGPFAGGNVKDAMGGVQQPGMGGVGGPGAGPQIQGSQQSNLAEQAGAFYASGGGGNMNVNAGGDTNIIGGAEKGKTSFITTKDPMGWIVLQGNCVH